MAWEVDKLSQYSRPANVIVRNVFKPEKETNEEVTIKMSKIIQKELNLPHLVGEVDKMHRVGKILEKNGKKCQDVIIRFR